jgi:hypothetical protein
MSDTPSLDERHAREDEAAHDHPHDAEIDPYSGPAGGWGSLKAVERILTQEEVTLLGSEILLKQNKPDGYMCVSCSWAKPANPRPFEFCENGAKATGVLRGAQCERAAELVGPRP